LTKIIGLISVLFKCFIEWLSR